MPARSANHADGSAGKIVNNGGPGASDPGFAKGSSEAIVSAGRGYWCCGWGSDDFFVSHAGADRAWAEWVAWQLTEAGYTR